MSVDTQSSQNGHLKKKALRRAEHEQEIKSVQYKIIENLTRATGDKNITQKYEVYVLNAKKALTGIHKNRLQLYEASNAQVLISELFSLCKAARR